MATRVVTVTSLADIQANDRIIRSISYADGRIEATVERSAPEVEPGTVGTATVAGKRGVRVMRVQPDDRTTRVMPWATDHMIGGWFFHEDATLTDFVPDPDTAALERESAGYRADALTHLEDARRLSARADAAEARLARLTPAMVRSLWAKHAGIPAEMCEGFITDVLALVAADEQAAEGEAVCTCKVVNGGGCLGGCTDERAIDPTCPVHGEQTGGAS